MLIEPGDHILVDSPGYSGAFACLRPMFPVFKEVECDAEGLRPEKLEDVLASYAPTDPKRPKFLYTVPTGANPSGFCTSNTRREQIYRIARKYHLLILEDDPYYYLQFREPLRSYFSMDVDGRVLRFDSFSKVLSAGVRIGWVSGPAELLERIILHGQVSGKAIEGNCDATLKPFSISTALALGSGNEPPPIRPVTTPLLHSFEQLETTRFLVSCPTNPRFLSSPPRRLLAIRR